MNLSIEMPAFVIGDRLVGPEQPALVIAEVGQAHDGSLGIAHSYIDAIADAGADAVKFQTHIAEEESTPQEPWRVPFSYEDATRYDYWKRMEFTPEQWRGLRAHAEERGLLFLSSPFSLRAFEMLKAMDMQAWKVASGELGHWPLLEAMAASGRPVLLSSGMSAWSELDDVVNLLETTSSPYAVFQCTTAYPSQASTTGLNVLGEYADRYDCLTGLSDHSGDIFAGLMAVAAGASFVEVHVTFDKAMFGPDAKASLEFAQLKQLVAGVRFHHEAWSHPVDKDAVAAELQPMRALFTRSVVARQDLDAGVVLTESDLALKKPGEGLPPERMGALVGKILRRTVKKDEFLRLSDVELDSSLVS